MQKNIVKKGLAIAIIVLFICVAVSPGFYAEGVKPLKPKINPFSNKSVNFEVIEFKSDGIKEKTIVELTYEEAKEFGRKLKDIKTAEEELSIYKEYGFISEDVTLEKLKLGMLEKAQRNDLTEEKLKQYMEKGFSLIPKPNFNINLNCLVQGQNIGPFRLILGLSSITRVINLILWTRFNIHNLVPSVDLLNTQVGGLLEISAIDGLLNDINYYLFGGFFLMLCFVGYYINLLGFPFPYFWILPFITLFDSWFGYAAFVATVGYEL